MLLDIVMFIFAHDFVYDRMARDMFAMCVLVIKLRHDVPIKSQTI